jgi:hypothetical protein
MVGVLGPLTLSMSNDPEVIDWLDALALGDTGRMGRALKATVDPSSALLVELLLLPTLLTVAVVGLANKKN